jgi:anhydro-N-acetylmuramic acid kinase
MQVLGFMTGTSLDGIDMAVIDTDGKLSLEFGPYFEAPIPEDVRELMLKATKAALNWPRGAPEPELLATACAAITQAHIEAGQAFLATLSRSVDLIGVHGQTVLHERPKAGVKGRTLQLFDGQAFADAMGVPVICELRQADIEAGGEAAPLAPVYHQALVAKSGLELPCVVVNLGGVANITYVSQADPLAFDTGPASGMMDLLVQGHDYGRYDEDGRLAARGQPDLSIVEAYMAHDYFSAKPPKSLDRYDFSLDPVAHLSLPDGVATFSAFTVKSLVAGIKLLPQAPKTVVICGGGRQNPHLMTKITQAMSPVKVLKAEDLGWRGGAIEAEAFAYLASRSLQGLPISYPTTTGVQAPMTGGKLYKPKG